MKPTRPTPIVAAAVLLIAVGAQLILGSLVYGILWLFLDFRLSMYFEVGLSCASFLVAPLMAVIGFDFMRIGIDLLDGTLKDAYRPGYRIWVIGAMAIPVTVGGTCISLLETVWSEEPLEFLAKRVPLIVPIWFDVGATLVAGIMLREHSEKYLEWQKEYTKPVEPSGYEEEE